MSTSRASRAAATLALVLLATAVTVVPWVSVEPDAIDLAARRQAPSLVHPFGTDDLGRDQFSRAMHGGRISLAVGLLSALVAAVLGAAVGLSGGYRGGLLDDVLMRTTDAMLSIPRLPLLMVASLILQPDVGALVLLVGAVGWMEVARVVRAETLSLRARDFVAAAAAAGARPIRVIVRHLVPGVAGTLGVAATLAVARNVLLEAALSYFGVGVQPPTPSWGNMLYQAQSSMSTEPWLALFPGLCIFVTAFVVHELGTA